MATYKMYELNSADACQKRRTFNSNVIAAELAAIRTANGEESATSEALGEKKSDTFSKAAITKSIIKEYYSGELMYPEIDAEFERRFIEVMNFKSDAQRLIQQHDALRQIHRYIDSEKREANIAFPATTHVYTDMDVVVSPDLYFIDEENSELEVVKVKCSKPHLSQKAAQSDIAMYSMLVYANELAEKLNAQCEDDDKKIKYVKASYYYLGKSNDSYSIEKPRFDSDFFDTKGAGNIVYVADDIGLKGISKEMVPTLNKFIAGIPENECSKKDCEHCVLYDMCKFEEPPLALTKTASCKKLSDVMLTDAQTEAIDVEKGIYRINAGAGAGKTMVIALRTATLINKGVKPEEICLMTFTNAGAEEMRSRIKLYLEDFGIDVDITNMTIMTFNAFGDSIIKANYEKFGFLEAPELIDDVERSHIIAELLNAAVDEPYTENGAVAPHPLRRLNWRNFAEDSIYVKGALTIAKRVFNIMKANSYSAADIKDIIDALGTDYNRFVANDKTIFEIAKLYDKFDDLLRSQNLIEYSDQEALIFELLHQEPYYFEQYGFKHIIIDEFQDSNQGQIDIIKILIDCPTFESLMVVGDDSQAIFGFRDTSPEFIINFENYIGQATTDINLVENHRSTPEIIEFANQLNAKNVYRVNKELVATRPSGKPVEVEGFLTPQEERSYVLDGIKEHLANGFSPEDIAIICYTKYELQEMATLLGKEGIPTILLNPELLSENSRVKAAIALVNAINDITDTVDALTFANALSKGELLNMSDAEKSQKLAEIQDFIKEFHAEGNPDEKKKMLMKKLSEIDYNDDEIYQSFLKTLDRKNLFKLLEYVDEFTLYGSKNAIRREHSYNGVVLTTAHSSKGLEWPICYNMITKYHDSNLSHKETEIEERRRLLFVSATRARDELYITGQYVAFGKRGDYVYNRYLIDSYNVVGKEFSVTNIENERTMRQQLLKAQKAEEKRIKELEEAAKTASDVIV